jgi:hypothetical protein
MLGRSGGSSALTTVRLAFAMVLFLFSGSRSRIEACPKTGRGLLIRDSSHTMGALRLAPDLGCCR